MNTPLRTTLALAGSVALVAGSAAPALASSTAGRPLTATLSGANEVTAAGLTGVGDPDGAGSARVTINVGQKRLCFSLKVTGVVTPTAVAHIHDADAGVAGPVVIPIGAPGVDGTASGCVPVARALLKEILHDPAGYYVNVHTSEFPGGAVRGQLAK